nr:replication factor C subunit 2/4 [Seculamonas ecuadoriensis]
MDDLPWIEKHRPRKLDEVVGNEEAVQRMRLIAADGNIPNLLLIGPPGTGKTTSIMCLAREVFENALRRSGLADEEEIHKQLQYCMKEAVLELNASDERKLDTVRTRIKQFAQKKVTLPGVHKLVILDEADSMTKESQQALRRIMEKSSSTTRFAFACNNSTDVIEPLQSRCAVVRFTRLADHEVLQRVMDVCQAEGVTVTDDGLDALVFTSEGDLRSAMNNLQSTWVGFQIVNAENVFKVCDQPPPLAVIAQLKSCIEGDLSSALDSLNALFVSGFSATDIIKTLNRVVQYNAAELAINEGQQLSLLREIGVTHMRFAEGVESQLQIAGLYSKICLMVAASKTHMA